MSQSIPIRRVLASSVLLSELRAMRGYRERCGVLLGETRGIDMSIHAQIELPNRASNTACEFRIDADDVLPFIRNETLQSGVIGFFHTHPDGSTFPSRQDRDGAWPNFLHVIIGARVGAFLRCDDDFVRIEVCELQIAGSDR